LALLWLAGVDLRMTLLAVPPVLPAIHHDLGLTEAGVGALNGLPVVLMAIAAVPGSLLIARLGARRALVTGLVLVGVTSALRGIGPAATVLFTMSFLMGIGVAVSQPAMPTITKDWFPARVGLATAIYADGLLVGEIIPTTFSGPALAAVRESWELSLVLWSLPVLATAVLIVMLTPAETRAHNAPQRVWWPDWRSWRTWQAGLILGCVSMLYWGSNAFLPDFLDATGRGAFVHPSLAVFNAAQLPASILIALAPGWFIGRRWPYLVAAASVVVGVPGMLLMGGAWVVIWTALLGFISGGVFVCALALPPLLAEPEDVARLSAAMLTITYTCSFLGPVLGGALWDLSGVPLAAFAPAWIAGFAMAGLAAGLRLSTKGEARLAAT
jgi:MFS transporter, CP family, cyanate transporter